MEVTPQHDIASLLYIHSACHTYASQSQVILTWSIISSALRLLGVEL